MDQGYVYLHRKLLSSRVFQSEGLLKVWVWCLLKATHKGRWAQMKRGKGTSEIWLKPGQFIFGRKSAAKFLKMPPSTFRNRMEKLKSMQNLDIKKDSTYSVCSIINWDSYQGYKNKKDTQKDTYRTPKGHLKDTDNNVNNVNNDKNNKKTTALIPEKSTLPPKKTGDSATASPKKPEKAGSSEPFYLTKKKRKLKGWKLETFEQFWNTFNWKKDKANAADSWLQIPGLTKELAVEQIIPGAARYCAARDDIILNKHTPKWAQGWLSSRRWEDETFGDKKDGLDAFLRRHGKA